MQNGATPAAQDAIAWFDGLAPISFQATIFQSKPRIMAFLKKKK